MKLRCYAYFRDILGSSEVDYNQPATNLGELLKNLSRRYGRPFNRWVYADAQCTQMSHMVIILVNGKDARDQQWLKTPLHPDDTITLFPPLAGG